MYQDEEGSVECKNCPSGSVREIHINDDKGWNGIIGGAEHNTNEASDCLVCASGKYQEEHGMTSCKSCPLGTIRPPASGKDGMPWDAIGKENFIFLVSVGQRCSDFSGYNDIESPDRCMRAALSLGVNRLNLTYSRLYHRSYTPWGINITTSTTTRPSGCFALAPLNSQGQDVRGLTWLNFNPISGSEIGVTSAGGVNYGKFCQRTQSCMQASSNGVISINGVSLYCDTTTDPGHNWRIKLFQPSQASEIDTKEKMIDFCKRRGFTSPGRGVERVQSWLVVKRILWDTHHSLLIIFQMAKHS